MPFPAGVSPYGVGLVSLTVAALAMADGRIGARDARGGVTLHATSGGAANSLISSCSSNATHCGWITDHGKGEFENMDAATARLTDYLWINIMPYDVPRARTLGFDPEAFAIAFDGEGDGGEGGASIARSMLEKGDVDGLSDGVMNQTLHYSLEAKKLYPWTDAIPRSVYLEYVVPYAVVNEPRSDNRPLLFNTLKDVLKDYARPMGSKNVVRLEAAENHQMQIKEAVKLINTRLWSIMGKHNQPIVFEAGLTPRIYDPLSVIAYGHSSCTGLAILFVSALRSVGIPARMAGTPAWHGNEEEGNHSWVEVYLPDSSGGKWTFLEPSPGIAEGDEKANSDDLDRDPCKRWFCSKAKFDGLTKVFATRFSKGAAKAHYPMAWSGKGDVGVPGEERTDYYTGICNECPR